MPTISESFVDCILAVDYKSLPRQAVEVARTAVLDTLAVSMAADFDDALAGLAELERMYAEPDGSFVWTSSRSSDAGAAWWQVDGNACEKDGRVLLVDLKGSCPPAEFDRLLAAFGWPAQPMMMLLVRSAVFLGEEAFRRHAMARGLLGDGETLRPS